MGDLSNQFLNAMNILVEKGVSDLKFDRTVEAIITGIKDENAGEYWVKYNGNILLVYSRDPKEKYRIDDRVFIKIPENDLSNKKFIESKSNTISGGGIDDNLDDNDISNLEQTFLPVEPSILEIYELKLKEKYELIAKGATEKVEICSCSAPVDLLYEEITLTNTTYESNKYYIKDNEGKYILDSSPNFDAKKKYYIKNFAASKFQKYLKKYSYILLSGDFQSLLSYPFTSGNYGLQVRFYNAQDINKDIIYNLDINSFNGNPYKFINNTHQQVIIQVDPEKTLGLKSIHFFQEGFPHYDYHLNESNIKVENSTKANLFVSNINLQFAEKVDLSKDLYYLQIQAPQGIIFDDNTTFLDLVGRLISEKQSIMTEENSVCKWYKRDSAITVGDKFYDKSVGPGWRKVIYDEEFDNEKDLRKEKEEYEKLLTEGTSDQKNSQLNKIKIIIQEVQKDYQDLYNTLIRGNNEISNVEISALTNFQSSEINQSNYSTKIKDFEQKLINCKKVLIDPEVVKFNTITIPKKIVNSKNDYQLGVVYNNKIQLFQSASVYKYGAEYDVIIEKTIDKENNEYLQLVSKDGYNYVGDWYFSLPGGDGYQAIPNGKNVPKILINDYLAYQNPIFICDIKIKTGAEEDPIYTYIETREFQYNVSNLDGDENDIPSANSISVTFVGESVFNYDANGDITLKDASVQRKLSCILNRKDLEIEKIEWFIKDEENTETPIRVYENKPINRNEFTNFSSKSMLENLWVDNKGNLYYNIKQKYRLGCNNTVYVKIIVQDQEYYFQKELIFLKDGNQGTNGTTCSLIVQVQDNDNSKKHYLHYNNGWINNGPPLKLEASLFEDGVNITSQVSSWEWTCGDNIRFCDKGGSNIAEKIENSFISYVMGHSSPESNFPTTLNKNNTQFYVKVKAQYKGIFIYNIFPIKVIIGDLTEEDANKINLPDFIQYNASGENPEFDQTYIYGSPFINYTSIPEGNWQKIKVEYNNSILVFRPARKFLCDEKTDIVNAIKCHTENVNNYLIYPVIMYLNRYGNEAINGWDGTQIEINKTDGYILAPQIGAGEKHNDNTFSGVVMGTKSLNKQTGLYGFSHGEATFGFEESGKAFIGSSKKGQILFDTDSGSAIIQSANYKENEIGIKLDLTNGTIEMKGSKELEEGKTGFITINADANSRAEKPLEIGIGNDPNFSVGWDGSLFANSGTIGGWKISSNGLTSYGEKSGFNSNAKNSELILWAGNSSKNQANFKVAADGTVTISNAILKGNITWDTTNTPVQVQYTTNPNDSSQIRNEWDDAWTNNNIKVWARYSYDGGKNYGVWTVIQGVDGEPGSSGSGMDKVAINKYLRETYGISDSETTQAGKCYIYSPNIISKRFEVVAPENPNGGGFFLKGNFSNKIYDMFAIEYYGASVPPSVLLYSPAEADIYLGEQGVSTLYFRGDLNFEEATSIKGLKVYFS